MVVVDDEADPEETKRVPSVRQTRNSVIRIELISIIAVVRSLQIFDFLAALFDSHLFS